MAGCRRNKKKFLIDSVPHEGTVLYITKTDKTKCRDRLTVETDMKFLINP